MKSFLGNFYRHLAFSGHTAYDAFTKEIEILESILSSLVQQWMCTPNIALNIIAQYNVYSTSGVLLFTGVMINVNGV